jgi:hypothetical protein
MDFCQLSQRRHKRYCNSNAGISNTQRRVESPLYVFLAGASNNKTHPGAGKSAKKTQEGFELQFHPTPLVAQAPVERKSCH